MIALNQKQAGAANMRNECSVLWLVLSDLLPILTTTLEGRDDGIPVKKLELRELRESLKVTSSPGLKASSVHYSVLLLPSP